MNNFVIVAAAIIRDDEKILIAKRGAASFLGGKWEFPGGKVEPGEDLLTCLAREIREELGVGIKVGEPYEAVIYDYGAKGVVRLHSFLCNISDGEPRAGHSHSELKWVAQSELGQYEFVPADIPIAKRLSGESA
ncbi:MAG: (deoxy)nucleoside triphosphate pyrophosphohydrolase [Candidatus Sungiibacteriota bacterium]